MSEEEDVVDDEELKPAKSDATSDVNSNVASGVKSEAPPRGVEAARRRTGAAAASTGVAAPAAGKTGDVVCKEEDDSDLWGAL